MLNIILKNILENLELLSLDIQEAREDVKKGRVYSHQEIKDMFGIK